VRAAAPTLPDQAPPELVASDDADAPAKPTTVLLTRRQVRQVRSLHRSVRITARRHRRRPGRPALAASAALLAAVSAGVGGIALALRPAPEPPRATALDIPVDPSSVTATATSTQAADGSTTYTAANTLDGDPATAWNSNGRRDGKGPGIALTYTFARPVALRAISLRNGYQRTRQRPGRSPVDLYPVNGRVRRLRVVTDTGTWTWNLADTRAQQSFAVGAGRTGSVRLEILTVYSSKTYPDVAISEVGFTSALER